MKAKAAELARDGVYIGTSSWKYPGWIGLLYTRDRYEYRGKLAEARFKRDSLREYAEVFKTVCVDAAYYSFPTIQYLQGLAEQVPDDFRFGLKVTDDITIKRFANLARFGDRAGKVNARFLNHDLFSTGFLGPCEHIRQKIGVIIFEFSKFHARDYSSGRQFLADLDAFLSELPEGWPIAVELRNRSWLVPDYFRCLSSHGVAHVFNSWTEMPAVSDQMMLSGSRTSADLTAARFLLKPGRTYEESVKLFEPYAQTRELRAEERAAAARLVNEGLAEKRRTFVFANNRLEGQALNTLDGIVSMVS